MYRSISTYTNTQCANKTKTKPSGPCQLCPLPLPDWDLSTSQARHHCRLEGCGRNHLIAMGNIPKDVQLPCSRTQPRPADLGNGTEPPQIHLWSSAQRQNSYQNLKIHVHLWIKLWGGGQGLSPTHNNVAVVAEE